MRNIDEKIAIIEQAFGVYEEEYLSGEEVDDVNGVCDMAINALKAQEKILQELEEYADCEHYSTESDFWDGFNEAVTIVKKNLAEDNNKCE